MSYQMIPVRLRVLSVALTLVSLMSMNLHEGSAQDLQNLQPTHGRLSYVSVEGVRTLSEGEWNLSSYMHYGKDPLLLVRDGEVQEVLVRYITTVELIGAVSLHDRFELGIAIPYNFTSGVSSQFPVDDGQGMGDLRLNPKLILVRPKDSEGAARGFGLGVHSLFILPTGDREREETSDREFVRRHFSSQMSLIAEYLFERARVALNAGYRFRPTRGTFDTLTDLDMSSGLTWGAAFGYRFKNDFEVNVEAFQRFMSFQRAPMEGIISARSTRSGSINPMFGIGAGLGGDFSSVGLRIIGGLTWTPGQSGSGFPMTDSDKDGLIDVLDRCPNKPEDLDGQEDQDGCPEEDADRDGVLDEQDRCPNQREDIDQFEDQDGCPDPDNDRDGLLDIVDRCPLKAETMNQFQDQDGCPDQRVEAPAQEGELIGLSEKIFFEHNESIILKRSYPILGQVADLLKRHPRISLVRIEGHTDDTGGVHFNLNLSQRRAEAVRLHLIGLGVEMERLKSVGYGDQKPIASNDTEDGKALNRRVNFRIISGPQEIFKVDTNPSPAPSHKVGPSSESSNAQPSAALPRPPKASSNRKGRSFAVQVKASYRLRDSEKVRDRLMKERFPAYILSVDQGNGRMVHRVRVGPYQTKDEAQSAMSTYEARFPDESGGGYIVGISASEAKKYR